METTPYPAKAWIYFSLGALLTNPINTNAQIIIDVNTFSDVFNATDNVAITDYTYVDNYSQWQQDFYSLINRGQFRNLGNYSSYGITSNYHRFYNDDVLDNYGSLVNQERTEDYDGYFENSGTTNNYGNFINKGDFQNRGTLNNYGTLDLFASDFPRQQNIELSNGTINNHGLFLLDNADLYVWGDGSPLGSVNLLAGGTLDSRSDLFVEHNFELVNDGTFLNKQYVNIDGSLTSNGSINNTGSFYINHDGTLNNNGSLINEASYDDPDTGYRYYPTIQNDGTFNNSGTFVNKGDFNNNGTLNNYGTLDLFASEFPGQQNIELSHGTINNHGLFILDSGGLYAWGENSQLGSVNLLTGGTLDNRSDLFVEHNFELVNDGTFLNKQYVNIDGTLTSNGSINNTGGFFINRDGTLNNNGSLINEASSEDPDTGYRYYPEIQNDGTFNNNGTFVNKRDFNNNGTLNNYGTLNLFASDFPYQQNIELASGSINNYGLFILDSGNLYAWGDSTQLGSVNLLAGGTLDNRSDIFVEHNFELVNDGALLNRQYFNIDGTLASNGSINNTGGFFINRDGTLNNNGSLINEASYEDPDTGYRYYPEIQNDGTFNNNGTFVNKGNFQNGGTINNNGMLNLFANTTHLQQVDLNQGTINNSGLFILSGDTSYRLGSGGDLGTVNLNSGGTLDNRSHLIISNDHRQINDGLILNNREIFNDGTIDNRGAINNTDLLANQGTIHNTGSITNSGRLDNNGTIINENSVSITGELRGSGTYRQLAGHTNVNGLMDQQLIEIEGGTLSGSGVINGDVTLGTGASINPGNSPGTLHFEDNLFIDEEALITFEIAGTEQGEFDQIIVDGLFDLEGSIEFVFEDDFTIDILSEFTIFDFILLSYYDPADFMQWNFTDTRIALNLNGTFAVSQVPVPAAAWLFGSALLGLIGVKRRRH